MNADHAKRVGYTDPHTIKRATYQPPRHTGGHLKLAYGLLWGFALLSTPLTADDAELSQTIDHVRGAVVQISIFVPGMRPVEQMQLPKEWAWSTQFSYNHLVAGTGFFVNMDGDVATAFHVIRDSEDVIQKLSTLGITATLDIGVALPNIEGKSVLNIMSFGSSIIARDPEHDIAIVHPDTNPFSAKGPKAYAGPNTEKLNGKVVLLKLATKRPKTRDEIFACGFPMGSIDLVSTAGAIASEWGSENLLTAKSSGNWY